MDTFYDSYINGLRDKAFHLMNAFYQAKHKGLNTLPAIPAEFKKEFFGLVDKVTLSLMEDTDNFYGYFLFQMSREIAFDLSSPTAVNFKGANYVIYFNPVIFLNLNRNQMESTIKHEILHILSLHLPRAKELKGSYSKLAINMAMDLVVNQHLNHLPPYAITLEMVNTKYAIKLEAYQLFEYYAEKLQDALNLLEEDDHAPEDDTRNNDTIKTKFNPDTTHDLWEASSDIDESTLIEFTEKVISNSEKGVAPAYVQSLIASLKSSKGELPWNLYLNRMMGTVESNKKLTVTRRNRRQPERLELRGQLRSHKAKIAVAIDISGSIRDEEFKQAMKEVINIVKNYNHVVTIIECDDQIQRVYQVKAVKDIKDRLNKRGSTKFNPVIEYANQNKINLLIYFTDGKGEDKLKTIPRGYHILWIISGHGEELSLKKPYGLVKKLSKVEIKDNILDASDVSSGGFSMNYHEKII